MRIAIDVREACKQNKTGKGQWSFGLVEELIQRNIQLVLLTDNPTCPPLWSTKDCIEIHTLPTGWRWHRSALLLLRNLKPDWYISPTSFIVPALLKQKIRCVVVVHDLIAFLKEPHTLRARLIERLFLRKACERAACIACLSDATRHDLLGYWPRFAPKSITVYAGAMDDTPLRSRPDGKTILSIGTLCPRKNQLRLIQAYRSLPSHLREQYQLVLVGGRGWHDAQIVEEARSTEGVTWQGYSSPEMYDTLLSTCTILAHPSLTEGFGLQVLDALKRGIPVLTSSRGSLPEVAADAALYVDPEDVEAIGHGLETLCSDAALRDLMCKRGLQRAQFFTWKRTVDTLLQALQGENSRAEEYALL